MQGSPSFGYLVRRHRKARDLTQRELAAQVHCAVVTVQKIETDQRRPSPEMAALLAEALAVPEGERAAFVAAARGERSPARLRVPDAPVDPGSPLPVPASALIGRGALVDQVAALLDRARLVTLTGPGGAGKSRVALEVAAAVPGACFVDLAPIADHRLVLRAIADALGLPLRDHPPPTPATAPTSNGGVPPDIEETLHSGGAGGHGRAADALARRLGDREVLVLLDGCEHVVEAAAEVARLLAGAPGLRVLATSQVPLRIGGRAGAAGAAARAADAGAAGAVAGAARGGGGGALPRAGGAGAARVQPRRDGAGHDRGAGGAAGRPAAGDRAGRGAGAAAGPRGAAGPCRGLRDGAGRRAA